MRKWSRRKLNAKIIIDVIRFFCCGGTIFL
jgi:hypothetical protein